MIIKCEDPFKLDIDPIRLPFRVLGVDDSKTLWPHETVYGIVTDGYVTDGDGRRYEEGDAFVKVGKMDDALTVHGYMLCGVRAGFVDLATGGNPVADWRLANGQTAQIGEGFYAVQIGRGGRLEVPGAEGLMVYVVGGEVQVGAQMHTVKAGQGTAVGANYARDLRSQAGARVILYSPDLRL